MLLEVQGLAHEIGGRRILGPLDFSMAPGQHMLVLGPSGSGKTTLLHILAGLVTPSSGRVLLDGAAVQDLPPAKRDALRRRGIGLVLQNFALISALTVRQNLALAQRLALGRGDAPAAGRLLRTVGLQDRADAKPRHLSQGESQRAAIARALAAQPALIVADEPTSALDDVNAGQMLDLLLSSAEATGATLLIATHDQRVRERFRHSLTLGQAA